MIGRCDPKEDHSEIADKIDDYLWLKLSQLSYESEDSGTAEKLTLSQLQTMLLEEYGLYLKSSLYKVLYKTATLF